MPNQVLTGRSWSSFDADAVPWPEKRTVDSSHDCPLLEPKYPLLSQKALIKREWGGAPKPDRLDFLPEAVGDQMTLISRAPVSSLNPTP